MFIGLGNTIPGPKGQFGISADFSYPVTSWCKDDGNKAPIISGASGGVFTFTTTDGSSNVLVWENPASPSTTSDDGIINTTATPAGSYEITYTVQGLSNSVEITITADVSTTFTYPNGENRFTIFPTKADPSISGDFAITTNPGNLSINSTTGAIDLSTATAGQVYTVTFTPTGTPCGNTTTASFTVVQAFQSFEFTIQVNAGDTFTIPTTGSGYSYRVNWGLNNNNNLTNFVGQGNSTSGNNYTGNATSPTYINGGTYTIQIGDYNGNAFPRIYFRYAVDKLKLKNITKWGEFQWSSFSESFYGCTNLDISATDTPDLTNCNNLYRAFFVCQGLTGTLSGVNWNWTFPASNTTVEGMFQRANLFNGDVSNWDTSNVTSFQSLFSMYGVATGVFNRNLNSWNTSNVTNMSDMFQNQSFNSDISNWDTSNVTDMSAMFINCSSFNQDVNTKDYTAANRLAWDVSSCANFTNMFSGASSFNTSINKWKIKTTGSAFSMSGMLASSAYNQALNTSEITVGQGGYQQTYLAWDVQNVNNFSSMFSGSSFNQSLSNWDMSSATTMNTMFGSCPFNQPINTQSVTVGSGSNQRTYNAWDVSLVNNTFRMFRSTTSFNQDLSSWNTQSFLNAGEMFYQANAFDQDISSWDINQVTSFSNFMLGVALSTTNYDALLTAWDSQGAMAYSGTADFGNSVPSCDNAASNGAFAARASLITKWGGISDKFSQNNTCKPLAGFDYTSNAYCANGSDVTPTITGTVDQTLPLGGTISDAWSSSDYFQSFKFKVTTQTTNETFTFNGSGSYHIDWGDGNGFQGPHTNAQSFQYSTIGQQNTVTVGQSGDELNLIYSYGDANVPKITEISQWMEGFNTSTLKFQHTGARFAPLNITATNVPGFKDIGSGGASLFRIFANLPSTNGIVDSGNNLSKWNLDNVTNIKQFFGPNATGIPTSFNPNTKQVTYNNETYLAWDIKNVINVQDSDVGTSTAPNNWDTSNVTSFASLGLQNIQVPYQSVTVGSKTYNQWDISAGTVFINMFSGSFDNTSPKDWILGSQLSNTTNSLWFSYPASWGGASTQSDNYTNCWIGWAITIYNGVASKGYSQNYLTNLNLSGAHVHYNGKFNNSLAINSTLHPNAPSSWSTAQDAADYLVNTQGWTVNTGFF